MNRSILKIFTLTLALLFAYSTTTFAQYTPAKKKKPTSTSKKNDKYFDESGDFVHHLQYGIHVSPSLFSLSGGAFNFRIDPSIGYHFNKTFMAGITGGVDYLSLPYTDNTGASKHIGVTSFNYGVYGRVRVFPSFYIHTDYKQASYAKAATDGSTVFTQSLSAPELNVGLVYRGGSGTGWGTEFMLLYDALYKDSYSDYNKLSPFDIKIGMTYNF